MHIETPRDIVIEMTPLNPFDRFPNGRPRVPDDLIARMKFVTTEEAWGVPRKHGYHRQFEGNWMRTYPDTILVGRAVTAQWVQLERALKTPVCMGEDIYLKKNFRPLFEAKAIAVCHPDLATSGGILETKQLGDLAQEHGISMALHMAGTPVSTMAAVHCAAATENFIALEHHFADVPFWSDLVTGAPKPIIQNGYIQVPDAPGLGIDLNADVIKAHLVPEDSGYFEPTTYWDTDRSSDRLWS